MLIKRNLAVPFYVQDERYNVVAWMPLNVYVQDERYNVVAWMPLNVYVQDERYNVVAWSLLGFHAFATLAHPCASMPLNVYVQAFLRHPVFQGISASMHVDERY
jgi:hypothetical protein